MFYSPVLSQEYVGHWCVHVSMQIFYLYFDNLTLYCTVGLDYSIFIRASQSSLHGVGSHCIEDCGDFMNVYVYLFHVAKVCYPISLLFTYMQNQSSTQNLFPTDQSMFSIINAPLVGSVVDVQEWCLKQCLQETVCPQ